MNSYYAVPTNPDDVLGTTDYGVEFCSVVARRQRDRDPVPRREERRARPAAPARLRGLGRCPMLTKRLIACFDVIDGRVTKAQQFQDNIDVAPGDRARPPPLRRPDRRDRLLRHHGQRAEAQDRPRDGARRRRARLRAVHRRRRHPLDRRHVRGAQGRRREDQHRLDGGARARHHPPGRRGVRSPVHRAQHPGEAGRADGRRSRAATRCSSTALGSRTGMDAIEWVRRGEDLGAGEIVVNSIDHDGTGVGLRPRDHPRGRRRGERPGDRVRRRREPRPHRRRAHPRRRVGRDHQLDPLLAPARPEPRRPGAQGRAGRARRADAPLGRDRATASSARRRADGSQAIRGASVQSRSSA